MPFSKADGKAAARVYTGTGFFRQKYVRDGDTCTEISILDLSRDLLERDVTLVPKWGRHRFPWGAGCIC